MMIIHMTSDRGLCGGLNSNINRHTSNFITDQDKPASMITVGKKGRDFMFSAKREIEAKFIDMNDRPTVDDILPIAQIVIQAFISTAVDQVFLSFPKFASTVSQVPTIGLLLPIEPVEFGQASNVEYIYEPNSADILSQLLPRYVEMQIFQSLLETIASEHSARMVAMKNATENANEMIENLTLVYNKARQEIITTELLDITGGAAALA
jgi:F-type H+-transporting ATPase subunit gamma